VAYLDGMHRSKKLSLHLWCVPKSLIDSNVSLKWKQHKDKELGHVS